MTKDELAKSKGLQIYDCALPQDWIDDVVATLKRTGFGRTGMLPKNLYDRVLMGTVWSYDGSLFGQPVALTPEVEVWIKMYEYHKKGIDAPRPIRV